MLFCFKFSKKSILFCNLKVKREGERVLFIRFIIHVILALFLIQNIKLYALNFLKHKILQAYVIFDTNLEKLSRFNFGCRNFKILPKYGISKDGRFTGKLYK